ncbi:WecB/TagA/CpsF family glycosyltransferase [Pseudalkalibacillus salsuginis]|uniref:WecB/TagA/CpsF family glycosyltransferase n=1 Tax=Pseudalkalibacillus salsuginis TaxID=2910972 RepID=UPI001F3EC07C|nr:WecB/TagA/CpsF family glycosyltransferase [Pseudalkalibacillus salsuginis]MCF6410123.1 WecB/TagA/CpsF family glycosyltransferase [Pseudalkalibacillus salsuginis]
MENTLRKIDIKNDDRVEILNVPFVKTPKDQFIDTLLNHIKRKEKKFVITANPEIVMQTFKDPSFKQIVKQSSYVTPDGIGIVIASKMLNKPIPERITGFETMMGLLLHAEKKDHSVYFIGAKDTTMKKAVNNVHARFPGLRVAGFRDGYFSSDESSKICDEIKQLQPDMVFVGLGSPRQEKWIYENFKHFKKGIFMGVGGSFDVLSGEVKRAPRLWRKLNLEWMYRLITQPWRFKRMLELPKFLFKVFKEKAEAGTR